MRQRPAACLAALGLVLAALVLAAPLLHQPGSIWAGTLLRKNLVLGLLGAAICAYLTAVAFVLRVALPRHLTWGIAGLALAVRLALVPSAPFMSSDVYRYVWDGRVQAAGLNPYEYVANDPALARLRDTAIYPNINRLDYAHTIYPPAAQLLFWAASATGGSVAATKLALLLAEAAGIAALWRVLVLAGLPSARLLIYAWNPLAIWSFAADGHVDAAAVGLLGLALLARAAGRQGLTGALLGGAVLVKFLPVVVAPALWRRWGWRLPAACALTMAALYGLYWRAGWQLLGFLPAYTREEGMAQGSGFWPLAVLGRLVPLPHAAGTLYVAACAAALAGLALWMALRQRVATGPAEIVRVAGNAGLLATLTMLAMGPHYPWYYPWIGLFAAVAPWRSTICLSCVSLLLYADPYHATLLFPSLVFVPTLILAAADWRRGPLRGVPHAA